MVATAGHVAIKLVLPRPLARKSHGAVECLSPAHGVQILHKEAGMRCTGCPRLERVRILRCGTNGLVFSRLIKNTIAPTPPGRIDHRQMKRFTCEMGRTRTCPTSRRASANVLGSESNRNIVGSNRSLRVLRQRYAPLPEWGDRCVGAGVQPRADVKPVAPVTRMVWAVYLFG